MVIIFYISTSPSEINIKLHRKFKFKPFIPSNVNLQIVYVERLVKTLHKFHRQLLIKKTDYIFIFNLVSVAPKVRKINESQHQESSSILQKNEITTQVFMKVKFLKYLAKLKAFHYVLVTGSAI